MLPISEPSTCANQQVNYTSLVELVDQPCIKGHHKQQLTVICTLAVAAAAAEREARWNVTPSLSRLDRAAAFAFSVLADVQFYHTERTHAFAHSMRTPHVACTWSTRHACACMHHMTAASPTACREWEWHPNDLFCSCLWVCCTWTSATVKLGK